jgi:hypothetical protein
MIKLGLVVVLLVEYLLKLYILFDILYLICLFEMMYNRGNHKKEDLAKSDGINVINGFRFALPTNAL